MANHNLLDISKVQFCYDWALSASSLSNPFLVASASVFSWAIFLYQSVFLDV